MTRKRNRQKRQGQHKQPERSPAVMSPQELLEGSQENLQALVELREDVTKIINATSRPLMARRADLAAAYDIASESTLGAIAVQANLGKHAAERIEQGLLQEACVYVSASHKVSEAIVVGTMTCAAIERFQQTNPIIKIHKGGLSG